MLTGDTLFVGDIARPDLAVDKEEGARGIFHSLHEKLLTLPDTCEVWPGHLGGSLCGGPGMDMKVSSTIGYERAHNELLADRRRGRVRARARSPSLGPAAAELPGDRGAQPRPAPERDASRPAAHAAPGRAQARRGRARRRRAHRPASSTTRTSRARSASPRVRAGFGTKLAWVADREQRDRARRPRRRRRRATPRARRRGRHHEHRRLPRRRDDELARGEARRPSASSASTSTSCTSADRRRLQVLDVRERSEWDAGHIPGSRPRALPRHPRRPRRHRPRRPVAVICSSGPAQRRRRVAAAAPRRAHVIHVADGGVGTWEARGWPIEHPSAVRA